ATRAPSESWPSMMMSAPTSTKSCTTRLTEYRPASIVGDMFSISRRGMRLPRDADALGIPSFDSGATAGGQHDRIDEPIVAEPLVRLFRCSRGRKALDTDRQRKTS